MAKLPITEDPRSVTLPVMKVRQPIGVFYIGSISAKVLLEICAFDIRKLLITDHFESFVGIQREIDEKRVKQIEQYVGTVSATFPTAVILSVRERSAELLPLPVDPTLDGGVGENLALLRLSNSINEEDEEQKIFFKQIATVIDGQHRIEALKNYSGDDFYINVAIFIGLDKASEAEVFSTVNLAQTKVNRSLVFDLFAYSERRSPEKTCHEVAVVLDGEADSPFYKRIKRLGVATDGRFGETLSQATFVQGLIKHISKDPLGDRDIGKRSGIWSAVKKKEFEQLVLRPFFVSGEDEKIAEVVWNYFSAVKARWPTAWASTGAGLVLNKTTGYVALMRLFKEVFLEITGEPKVISANEFLSIFNQSSLTDLDFDKERFVPGGTGQADLYRHLKEECL